MLASDDTLTMAPLPRASRCGSVCLQVMKMPVRLVSSTWRKPSSLSASTPPMSVMPTLLCSTSMPPWRAAASSTTAFTSAERVTSHSATSAWPPACSIRRRVSCAAASSLSMQTTVAPAMA
jgi:hypothetical protein